MSDNSTPQQEASSFSLIQQYGETLSAAMLAFPSSFGAIMQQIAEQSLPIAKSVYDAMWQQYQESGACYGKTHKGMMRWLSNLSLIRMHEHEIERIRQHQQSLIGTRKMAERIRIKTTPSNS